MHNTKRHPSSNVRLHALTGPNVCLSLDDKDHSILPKVEEAGLVCVCVEPLMPKI